VFWPASGIAVGILVAAGQRASVALVMVTGLAMLTKPFLWLACSKRGLAGHSRFVIFVVSWPS
jgi:hypothetical protein